MPPPPTQPQKTSVLNHKKSSFGNRRTIVIIINLLILIIMETIECVVKNVKVVVDGKSAKVFITVDKEFDGFVKQDGVWTEAKVNYFSSARYPLVESLKAINEDIAFFSCVLGGEFGQAELGGSLFNAKINITRELKAAGEIVDDKPLERDTYITRIVKCELSSRGQRYIDSKC